jgi:hypothetical protein
MRIHPGSRNHLRAAALARHGSSPGRPLVRLGTLLLVALFAVALPTTAMAAPASPGAQAAPDLKAGQLLHFANGRSVAMPKDWSVMTIKDLAAIGVQPGTDYTHASPRTTAATVATFARTVGVRPMDANGCNQGVCIHLRSQGGSGPVISSWNTDASNIGGAYTCTYAGFWRFGTLETTSNVVCGEGGIFYGHRNDMPQRYGTNTKLCNTWVNWAGRPCKMVY